MIDVKSCLELHQRMFANLDARDTAIGERENAARQALEAVLVQCAVDRATIEQDRTVLVEARKLYSRFLGTSAVRLAA